jgi:hypothetical protein
VENKYSKINVKELDDKISELKEKLKKTFIKRFFVDSFEVIIDNKINFFCLEIEENEIKLKKSIMCNQYDNELIECETSILENKLVDYKKINFVINKLIKRVSFLDTDYKVSKEQDTLIKGLLIENEKLKKENNKLKNDFAKVSSTKLLEELKETCIFLEEKIKKFKKEL